MISSMYVVNVPWWGFSCFFIIGAFLVIFGVPFSVVELTAVSMIDVLSWLMIVLTLVICSLAILASKKIFFNGLFGEVYIFLVLWASLALIMTFSSPSMISLYWWFEASLVPLVFLIVGWGYQPERLTAVKYMVIYTLAGSLPFLVVILVMFKFVGSWVLWGGMKMTNWWWFMLAPFLVKLPLYGVHSWLPKAHVEAPVAGSMILAGLTLKMGGYGLIRVVSMFKSSMGLVEFFLCVMAIWGALISPLLCINQLDMKMLVAYSSVSHMGLVICGILTLSSWGFSGAVMMMVGHAFASSGLFFLVGVIFGWTGSRNFKVCKGILKVGVMEYFWGFVLLGVCMGMPFSIKLCGEVMLVSSCVQLGLMFCLVMVFMSILTAAYCFYFFGCLFHGGLSECVRVNENSLVDVFVLKVHALCAFLSVFLCDFFFFDGC
uniref:NADH-ubiquinone oxidoreductase chain 4 n=1 Tax=Anadara broughtonii TaxID=148819 RepID=M5AFH8_ANABR|nr:NADH dehydrogenase subunit 4 [Anadara broughtonii]